MIKNIVVLTGAGMSAESGLKTFRDEGGLWEGHNVYEVATPEAWESNPDLVQSFYNQRRKQILQAEPNDGHRALVELQKQYNVQIITQNVDDLHERAGSQNVLHLHGIITKAQSSINPELVYPIEGDTLTNTQLCELGSLLRPHVVWFGEPVPNMLVAAEMVGKADVLVVVGTSLQVYPAASLIDYVTSDCKVVLIDPNAETMGLSTRVEAISENASEGLRKLLSRWIKQ